MYSLYTITALPTYLRVFPVSDRKSYLWKEPFAETKVHLWMDCYISCSYSTNKVLASVVNCSGQGRLKK